VEKGGFDLAGAGLPIAGAILASLFLIIGLWEQTRPARREAEPAGPRWLANIALYALSEGGWFLLAPLLSFAVALELPVNSGHSAFGLHLVLMLVVLDASDYFLHRLSHRLGWLWRLHSVHHTDTDLDVTTTMRHHPGEVLLGGVVFAGIGLLVGAAPEDMAIYGVIAFGVQLLGHANVALPAPLERALGSLIVTPAFHRFHHSRDRRQSDANYGQILVVWDRLFGTLAPRNGSATPVAFGVDAFLAPRFRTIAGMLLQPLSPAAALTPPAQ
jgi:sterol desaturase/sphingolipid hydroxylase (fatty acid hydroxylase superfamily)